MSVLILPPIDPDEDDTPVTPWCFDCERPQAFCICDEDDNGDGFEDYDWSDDDD
jgi:hypothetical protein